MIKIPAVVCAAGRGQVLQSGHSKLADLLGGESVIERCVSNLELSGCFSPIILVVNETFGDEVIAQLLESGHKNLLVAYQGGRHGAANAAYCALDALQMLGAESFAIFFGEMFNVKPETCRELYRLHAQHNPDLTFLSCPHDANHLLAPQLSRYAHLKKGWSNGLRQTEFLRMYDPRPAEHGDDILGSAYICRREWFAGMYKFIPADRTKQLVDGFGEEYHLPWLVYLAVRYGHPYQALCMNVHDQILGINDRTDYEVAARILESSGGGSR